MTIGIAAFGPRAGEAVFRALQKAERVGEKSIHGFAVYAALRNDGRVSYYRTQRGGTTTLVTDGEITGVSPPQRVMESKVAGCISSGPDRKVHPLEKLLPANGEVGLVTGHRLPITLCRLHAKPLNLECLQLMKGGCTAIQAVEKVIEENPEADVGLIAVDLKGQMHLKNSKRVSGRTDAISMSMTDESRNVRVAVLLNSIFPAAATAQTAAETAFDIMTRRWEPDLELTVTTGLRFQTGIRDEVHVDDRLVSKKIVTSDGFLLSGRHICAIPYFGAYVVKEGQVIGRTVSERACVVTNGILESARGVRKFSVGMKSSTST